MSWLQSKLRTMVGVLIGGPAAPPDSVMHDRIEGIRDCMLEALGSEAPEFAYIIRRIRYSPDIQSLWYLRGDLMAVLAAKEGEIAAARRIDSISAMFTGLLPRGLGARSSPLKELERSGSSP
jgi:hypothetical protein